MPDDVRTALREFGMQLGTAYQIYDDCLDLVGTEEEFGKTLRTDLEKGKLTLPMLYLLEDASDSQRDKLLKRIIDQEALDLPVLVGIADYEGAIDRSLDYSRGLLDQAKLGLSNLAPSDYRDALSGILSYTRGLIGSLRA